MGEAAPLS